MNQTPRPMLTRRLLLPGLALPALTGCSTPFPPPSEPDAANAAAILDASAAAHGAASLPGLDDIRVSYAGTWRTLVTRLQPVLVDAGFRGASDEVLSLRDRRISQTHTGPQGQKQVVRQMARHAPGTARVWFNGAETTDPQTQAAAALVADGYALFLLGPMLLAGAWSTDRALTIARQPPERIEVDGRLHDCDVLQVGMAPGLGLSGSDRLALWIDRDDRLMRRVRFTLDGLDGTRGAVAEVDCWAHLDHAGIRWPTRFHERLLRPLPLAVHDWRMTALA